MIHMDEILYAMRSSKIWRIVVCVLLPRRRSDKRMTFMKRVKVDALETIHLFKCESNAKFMLSDMDFRFRKVMILYFDFKMVATWMDAFHPHNEKSE